MTAWELQGSEITGNSMKEYKRETKKPQKSSHIAKMDVCYKSLLLFLFCSAAIPKGTASHFPTSYQES
jgi:hypothetical protein